VRDLASISPDPPSPARAYADPHDDYFVALARATFASTIVSVFESAQWLAERVAEFPPLLLPQDLASAFWNRARS